MKFPTLFTFLSKSIVTNYIVFILKDGTNIILKYSKIVSRMTRQLLLFVLQSFPRAADELRIPETNRRRVDHSLSDADVS